jgi:hypothetical protein
MRIRSGSNNNAALAAAPPASAIFCEDQPCRKKKIPIGRSATIAVSQKLGFTEASRIELNTTAIPQMTVAVRRASRKQHGSELDEEVEIDGDQKSADALRPNAHFKAKWFSREQINCCSDQSQAAVDGMRQTCAGNEIANAPPSEQKHTASQQPKEMLSNRDRAKISKRSNEKIHESRIDNRASEVDMAKLGADQFP